MGRSKASVPYENCNAVHACISRFDTLPYANLPRHWCLLCSQEPSLLVASFGHSLGRQCQWGHSSCLSLRHLVCRGLDKATLLVVCCQMLPLRAGVQDEFEGLLLLGIFLQPVQRHIRVLCLRPCMLRFVLILSCHVHRSYEHEPGTLCDKARNRWDRPGFC